MLLSGIHVGEVVVVDVVVSATTEVVVVSSLSSFIGVSITSETPSSDPQKVKSKINIVNFK